MGLIFYPPSPRFVDNSFAASLKEVEIKKVGVFVDRNWKEIQSIVFAFGLNALQLHGEESADQVERIKGHLKLPIIKAVPVKGNVIWEDLEKYLPSVDYFLFDTFTHAYGGSGKVFNWELLIDYPFDKPFILSGGLNPEHADLIKSFKQTLPQMAGIDINSKFEISPGLKNIDMIREFKNKIKN
jgi:phosphoribosylanthranilate isomerase